MLRKGSWMGLLVCLVLLSLLSPAQAQGKNCQPIEKALGYPVEKEKGVCRMELIRKGLDATHMGRKLSPETMELELMATFEKTGKTTAVMGEFALLEREVNPVIDRLRRAGLDVTAVHNHMLFERPRILYVHFQGEGSPEALAKGVRQAVQATSYRSSR
ncbi:DUF1259 domain-containing protein [Salinithrix halophila]|uniref:DUF1259 domain-containing protein n=1 Tax=Salinithrix halophila TaxID=1485204 RepID=A0ABV8JDU0_9BACL